MKNAERIIQQLTAAWNSKDTRRIEARFAAGATHQDVTSGLKQQGAAAIRDLFNQPWKAFPDAHTQATW